MSRSPRRITGPMPLSETEEASVRPPANISVEDGRRRQRRPALGLPASPRKPAPRETALSRTPRTRPSPESRERLLRAAEKLFAEKGYAATSVQEITDAAGVNKALLYYYFSDKRAVYTALIDDGVGAFQAVVEQALSTPGTYAERLKVLVARHVELLWQRPDLLRVVQRSQMTAELEDVDLRERFRPVMKLLVEFFREAVATGEFRELDPHMAALSMLTLNAGFASHREGGEAPLEADAVAAHVSALLLEGFRRR